MPARVVLACALGFSGPARSGYTSRLVEEGLDHLCASRALGGHVQDFESREDLSWDESWPIGTFPFSFLCVSFKDIKVATLDVKKVQRAQDFIK